MVSASALLLVVRAAGALGMSLQVESMDVQVNQPFNVTLIITSDGQQNLSDLELPDTGKLQTLGTSRSEGTTVNLGPSGASYRRTVRISMSLSAPEAGSYKLGP